MCLLKGVSTRGGCLPGGGGGRQRIFEHQDTFTFHKTTINARPKIGIDLWV